MLQARGAAARVEAALQACGVATCIMAALEFTLR